MTKREQRYITTKKANPLLKLICSRFGVSMGAAMHRYDKKYSASAHWYRLMEKERLARQEFTREHFGIPMIK